MYVLVVKSQAGLKGSLHTGLLEQVERSLLSVQVQDESPESEQAGSNAQVEGSEMSLQEHARFVKSKQLAARS